MGEEDGGALVEGAQNSNPEFGAQACIILLPYQSSKEVQVLKVLRSVILPSAAIA